MFAAQAKASGEDQCSIQFLSCESGCSADVACQMRCWDVKGGCMQLATAQNPKPTLTIIPYKVKVTVSF